MNKQELTEAEIRSRYITPALQASSWDLHTQIREEYGFTYGRILVRGKKPERGKQKFIDYLLSYKKELPLAVVEAKDNRHSLGDGMQQALEYAELLDVPYVFSSNGDGFLFHDRTATENPEKELSLDEFPTPEELYRRYRDWKGLDGEVEKVATQDYFFDPTFKDPRYYQRVAINRTVEAVAKGEKRILLVMATGTGKTFVAFQTIYRLWKSGAKKRVLFLADRNILIDQTKTNDFKPFGDKLFKITNRNADKAYEIYMALYQAVTGNDEERQTYRQFSPDFFDLIVVDECHRGSASDNSAWREVLDYFGSATQIGMTATPKETKDVSNMHYFGDPIYTYSLRQGIDDGFLAPYKVVRVTLDKDVDGYRPTSGELDKYGEPIPDKVYGSTEFDRTIVIDDRTKLVAQKISEYMRNTGDRYMKTIVFCVDIEHAERMRQALVNENGDLANIDSRYVVRITGDNEIGKRELDNFIDPESTYPVIATTSRLMSTGVDCQTCKLIVLDREVGSMTEFKQIIGRGTRLRPDFGKEYFTVLDFRRATDKFADPEFDGDPVQIYEPKPDEPLAEPTEVSIAYLEVGKDEEVASIELPENDPAAGAIPTNKKLKSEKIYVQGVEVKVLNEQVSFIDEHGKLITQSLRDYTRQNILKRYASMDQFLNEWRSVDQKLALMDELEKQGILLHELIDEVGTKIDPFDLVLHIAYGHRPIARKERAEKLKKGNYFEKYSDKAKSVIDALIDKYADQGIEHIETPEVLKVTPFSRIGTPFELLEELGGSNGYEKVVQEIEQKLYVEV
jgi:type I restriction enzyme R subunit